MPMINHRKKRPEKRHGLAWSQMQKCWTLIYKRGPGALLHTHALVVNEQPLPLADAISIYKQLTLSGTCLYCARLRRS